MTDPAAAAMTAIEDALHVSEEEKVAIASAAEMERSKALNLVILHFRGEDQGRDVAIDALDTLAGQIGHMVVPDEAGVGWDDDGFPQFDVDDLDEARRRAQCGQVADCLHHLERALPEGYGVIAERLAATLRRTS